MADIWKTPNWNKRQMYGNQSIQALLSERQMYGSQSTQALLSYK